MVNCIMKKTVIILLLFCVIHNVHSQERCDDVAYEFFPGKYRILASSASIYSQPNVTGSVVDGLDLRSEIEVIGVVKNSPITMDGVTHYWYKIQFNHVTGYVWGGYIAIETSVFDFGAAKVYCYYRVSSIVRYDNNYYVPSVLPNDIFVYFNDRRSNNDVIEEQYKDYKKTYRSEGIRESCRFSSYRERNRNIIILIHSGNGYNDRYYIKENGEIEYNLSYWLCG